MEDVLSAVCQGAICIGGVVLFVLAMVAVSHAPQGVAEWLLLEEVFDEDGDGWADW